MLKIIWNVFFGLMTLIIAVIGLVICWYIIKEIWVAIIDYLKKGSDGLMTILIVGGSIIIGVAVYPLVMKIGGIPHIAGVIISIVIYFGILKLLVMNRKIFENRYELKKIKKEYYEIDTYKLANDYYNDKEYFKAIERLNIIVTKEPENDLAYALLGKSYEELCMQALSTETETIETAPGKRIGHEELGNKANEYIDLALAINPDNVLANTYYAYYSYIEERYEEALERINRALKGDEKNIEAQNFKGEILRLMGRYEEAIKIYQNIIRNEPANTKAINGLGSAYLSIGNRKLAQEQYELLKGLDKFQAKMFKIKNLLPREDFLENLNKLKNGEEV